MRATDRLDAYLADERYRAFVWGSADCLQFPARWGEWLGFDVARFRGRCDDEASARAFVAAHGGAVALMSAVFGAPGDATHAKRGDVGLKATDGWHIGLICTGGMWAMRDARRGVRFGRIAPDVVWHIGGGFAP